ncbi:SDR family oxidoreductase [Nocardia sp. CA-119907]|uniref:SDR family oxidoreductase n=1 Tax=Nocardia sp. CA-119907 TaxID=3239973 RepID=UPI003D9928C4
MFLVVGGTGVVGRQVVERAVESGARVRVLTRAEGHAPPGAEVAVGDLHDSDSVATALTGVTCVVCTVHGGEGKGRNGPRGMEGSALPGLIDAAETAGVANFVYVSATSAEVDNPVDLFRGKAQVEARLSRGRMPYTILRPTHLMETWVPMLADSLVKSSRALIFGSGDNPVPFVAGTDIASAAVQFASRPANRRTVELGGPDDWTLRELNTVIAERLGIAISKETALSVRMLRMSAAAVRPFNEVQARRMRLGALLDSRPQTVDPAGVWTELGIAPTPLSDWLDRHLPARDAVSR